MIQIKHELQPEQLNKKLDLFWELSGEKIKLTDKNYDTIKGSPVFTVNGKYSTCGWTEQTQGFQFGSAILQFDATGDHYFLESGRKATLEKMMHKAAKACCYFHIENTPNCGIPYWDRSGEREKNSLRRIVDVGSLSCTRSRTVLATND